MRDFFDRLLGRGHPDDVFEQLAATQAAIDRGEDVSDRVVVTGATNPGGADLDAIIAAHGRTTYIPTTEDGEFGSASGFGGAPFLPPGVDHPICPSCHDPMPLMAQLAIDALPAAARPPGDGLIQAFYCDGAATDSDMPCDVDLEGWAPFSAASVVRLVTTDAGAPSTHRRTHPARRITGWTAYDRDLPTWDEAAELGIELPDELADEEGLSKTGDKLGGWPAWVQSVEYPDCPQCGARMGLVLQIDSEDHVPVMFGDMGTGHITQCPQHPEVLAFGWACA